MRPTIVRGIMVKEVLGTGAGSVKTAAAAVVVVVLVVVVCMVLSAVST